MIDHKFQNFIFLIRGTLHSDEPFHGDNISSWKYVLMLRKEVLTIW